MPLAGSAAPSSTVSRRGRTPVFLGLVLWLVAIAYFLLPVTLWVFDPVVLAVMWMFGIAGIICVAIGAIRRHRVVAGVVAVTVMVLITAAVGQWWSLSPRGWFATHRTLYERALRVEPGDGYYGRALPWHLRFLTVNGRVSGRGDIRFFPLWIGVPDDAGGYLHTSGRSPAGVDMHGMPCTNPVALGGDWWMCGVKG